jgi:hypothetical protein
MCRRAGGSSEEGTPVPIPNTEVKLFSSDDTLGAAPRENRTPPFHPPIQAVFGVSFLFLKRSEKLLWEILKKVVLRLSEEYANIGI